jgi:CMP-N-acetylneuraminic acid synthetase
MSIIALLPMKAHSERVPGKNFKDLGGKPLYSWILDTLLSVDAIDKVVINTDARTELAEFGLESSQKVKIRDRKTELCGDMVSMNRVLEDDILAVPADLYLMTHTTNPFVSADTIESAIQSFTEAQSGYDSLFSVNKIQTRFYREDGSAVNHDPDVLLRTQDLEPWYEENSCLYLFTYASFMANRARIGDCPLLFQTPPLESVDIDDPDDWRLAEALAKTVFGSIS